MYFFNVEGADYSGHDDEGLALPGPEQACTTATRFAGEVLRDAQARFWTDPVWRLEVIDAQGRSICALTIEGTLFSRAVLGL